MRRLHTTSVLDDRVDQWCHGEVGDVRDEKSFVELLTSLAPVDHIVFSGVDKIIRGNLEDLDLDDAKNLFGVKFWGAVVIGKGIRSHLR